MCLEIARNVALRLGSVPRIVDKSGLVTGIGVDTDGDAIDTVGIGADGEAVTTGTVFPVIALFTSKQKFL